jgi:hypothetical protein
VCRASFSLSDDKDIHFFVQDKLLSVYLPFPFFCVQLRSDSFQKQIRINRQPLSVGSYNLAKEIGLPLTGWHTFRRSSADNRRW